MKKMSRKLPLALAAAASFLLVGCATIVDGKKDTVTFNSVPDGAKVSVSGRVLGVTPLTVPIDREKNLMVSVEKDGYRPYQTQIGTSMNNWFWGNILIGGLFGSSTDASTGAMYEFSPNQYFATLSPIDSFNAGGGSGGASASRTRQIKEMLVTDGAQVRHELAVGGGENVNALITLIGLQPSERPSAIKSLQTISENNKSDLDFANVIIDVYEIDTKTNKTVSKDERVAELQSKKLSYEQYMKEYHAIMAE